MDFGTAKVFGLQVPSHCGQRWEPTARHNPPTSSLLTEEDS